jgi:3-oxoadipate enol-lactonase
MPTLRANGLRHYFRHEGRPGSQPLVLLHPIGADHSLFDQIVPLLLERFEILRPDLRGHGGTDAPQEDCTLQALTEDVLALTRHVGWNRFAACGVSLGGLIGLHAAITRPQALSALAVCSAAAVMTPPPGGWDQRAATARTQGMSALEPGMVDRMFSPDYRAKREPPFESLRRVFLQTDPEGYARCVAVLRDADLRVALPEVRTPTTLLHGTADPLITAEKISVLKEGIPASVYCPFSCGHFPPVEMPTEFARLLVTRLG